MPASAKPAVSSVRHLGAAWAILWIACSLAITGLDALLLEWTQHPFTAGMAASYSIRTPGELFSYAASALSLDLLAVALAWLVTLPLVRRMRLSPSQEFALGGLLGVGGPLLFSFARYRIQILLGPRLPLDGLLALADGSPLEVWVQGLPHTLPFVFLIATIALACALAIVLLRRWAPGGPSLAAPPPRGVLALLLCAVLASAASLVGVCSDGGGLCTALLDKPSTKLVSTTVRHATDFDRDGFGLLSRPRDPDPFDERVHPYALDQPGNGIDENGIGGDFPSDFPLPAPPSEQAPGFARRPHLLVIVLESFRGDLLGQRYNGREITPFLNRLAGEGRSTAHAHSNVPATIASRNQFFGGRLKSLAGERTLLHDFKDNGYFIAYFSGQDESFGALSEEILSLDIADEFYDAREDPDKNYAATDTPGTRAVSWKWLNQKVDRFLQDYDDAKPLFLYVNFHDTHYPYHHDEMDDILEVSPLAPSEIRPERATELIATYANAAANVDRGVEQLVNAFQRAAGSGETAILVTADHGESLFDNGVLGHGLQLAEPETRIPLILWGLGGDWPELIATRELRSNLIASLEREESGEGLPRPRFVMDPDRRILQFTPNLNRPSLLQLRGQNETLRYDVLADRFDAIGPDGQRRTVPEDEANELIYRWEAAALERARRGSGTAN